MSRGFSLADATRKMLDAGFGRVQPSESESTPELKGKVLGTNPPANADLGDHQRHHHHRRYRSGQRGRAPDCVGQSVDTLPPDPDRVGLC